MVNLAQARQTVMLSTWHRLQLVRFAVAQACLPQAGFSQCAFAFVGAAFILPVLLLWSAAARRRFALPLVGAAFTPPVGVS
jgi:hypothetical protein